MKPVYKLLLEACGLSVLITSISFIIETIDTPWITPAIPFGRYFLILLFSFSIVGANLLLGIKKLHKLVSLLLHYLIIFATFMLAFIGFAEMTPTKFFIYTAMFTLFYATVFAIVFVVKKLSSKADAYLDTKTRAPKKQDEYKPRYK